MGCNTKLATLNHLKELSIIDDVRRINDMYLFNKYNKDKTKKAEETYKLDFKGELLFKVKKNSFNTSFAEPNDFIFNGINKVKDEGKVKLVYQGINSTNQEDRAVQYYTLDKNEAKDYGRNVTPYRIKTFGFLNPFNNKDDYERLKQNFSLLYGKNFDILNNSPAGLQTQLSFFKYIAYEGYKGLDYTDYPDSQYLVTFKFDKDVIIEHYNALNETRAVNDFISNKVEESVLNELESSVSLTPVEKDVLYSKIDPKIINEMYIVDKEKALDLIGELIYNDEHFIDATTTEEQDDLFNRTCK
jgi:hypothetical protein